MKLYVRKTENQNDYLILMFTTIFIIGLTMLIFLLNKEHPSAQEDKVKAFLNKLTKIENPKEIFFGSCFICLDEFKKEKELKEIEKSENKENYEKEEISVLQCSHKFHKKCISEWIKKEEKCPLCNIKVDIKRNDDKEKKTLLGDNTNFNNILIEILRIQAYRNMLNEIEVSKIRRIYHKSNRATPSYSK